MIYKAKQDLAMVLPLPVPKQSPENALRFISMEEYPGFFSDLRNGFPKTRMLGGAGALGVPSAAADAPLEIKDVGSFEASFVPTIKDFARLDKRFRLADDIWESLPMYKDYGFAVFKLKARATHIHPMAFEFPRRNPQQLFVPTVHIHDGKIHDTAEFDHELYCQSFPEISPALVHWMESERHAATFMRFAQDSIVSLSHHCYRRIIRGIQKNEDVVV